MKTITIPPAVTVCGLDGAPVMQQENPDAKPAPMVLSFKQWAFQILSTQPVIAGLQPIESAEFLLSLKKKLDEAAEELRLENEEHRRFAEGVTHSKPGNLMAVASLPFMKAVRDARTED